MVENVARHVAVLGPFLRDSLPLANDMMSEDGASATLDGGGRCECGWRGYHYQPRACS